MGKLAHPADTEGIHVPQGVTVKLDDAWQSELVLKTFLKSTHGFIFLYTENAVTQKCVYFKDRVCL